MKNNLWGTESFSEKPVHVVLFCSRNKDNQSIEGFKERRESFITNKLYQAFCGKEDYSKSFITSEYLFHTVGNKELFDYTSVICGYTKSIEQLLYRLLQINLTSSSNRKLWIKPSVAKDKIPPSVIAKKHPSYEGMLIPFKKEYEQYFSNIMLSPMIDFLEHNWNGWKVSNTSKNYIIVSPLTLD